MSFFSDETVCPDCALPHHPFEPCEDGAPAAARERELEAERDLAVATDPNSSFLKQNAPYLLVGTVLIVNIVHIAVGEALAVMNCGMSCLCVVGVIVCKKQNRELAKLAVFFAAMSIMFYIAVGFSTKFLTDSAGDLVNITRNNTDVPACRMAVEPCVKCFLDSCGVDHQLEGRLERIKFGKCMVGLDNSDTFISCMGGSRRSMTLDIACRDVKRCMM
jgi:hypothetical protein